DREQFDLPEAQVALIKAVAAANPRSIVVLNNVTPIGMETWRDDVPALFEAWYPGQEGGNALARILFGEVNPSGKQRAATRWRASSSARSTPPASWLTRCPAYLKTTQRTTSDATPASMAKPTTRRACSSAIDITTP